MWNTFSDKSPTFTAVVVYVFEHSTHTYQYQLLVAPLSGREGSHCFSYMMLMHSITIQEIHGFICLLSAGFRNCLLFLPAMHRSWSVSSSAYLELSCTLFQFKLHYHMNTWHSASHLLCAVNTNATPKGSSLTQAITCWHHHSYKKHFMISSSITVNW
jgi:hypothetical protein